MNVINVKRNINEKNEKCKFKISSSKHLKKENVIHREWFNLIFFSSILKKILLFMKNSAPWSSLSISVYYIIHEHIYKKLKLKGK